MKRTSARATPLSTLSRVRMRCDMRDFVTLGLQKTALRCRLERSGDQHASPSAEVGEVGDLLSLVRLTDPFSEVHTDDWDQMRAGPLQPC